MKVYINNFNLQIFIFWPLTLVVEAQKNRYTKNFLNATEKEINRALSKKHITLLLGNLERNMQFVVYSTKSDRILIYDPLRAKCTQGIFWFPMSTRFVQGRILEGTMVILGVL